MKMLVLGYNCENFLEGYAKVTLSLTEIIHTIINENNSLYFLNINDLGIPLNEVIHRLFPSLYTGSLRVIDIKKRIPYLFSLLEDVYCSFQFPDILIYGLRPSIGLTFLLNMNKNSLIIALAYAFSHLHNYLHLATLYSKRKSRLIILNPYFSKKSSNYELLKLFPPVSELFFKKGIKFIEEKHIPRDYIIFRVMGRFHKSRGIFEAIKAFKKFKEKLPSAKTKLIIDTFSETIQDSIIKIHNDIIITIHNPLNIIKYNKYSMRTVLQNIINKYVTSSFIFLPYIYKQFIDPPYTLLEAFATGSYVIITKILTPFINKKNIYIIKNTKLSESLAKAYEYSYNIYDSREYWNIRKSNFQYAKSICSYQIVFSKLKEYLRCFQ